MEASHTGFSSLVSALIHAANKASQSDRSSSVPVAGLMGDIAHAAADAVADAKDDPKDELGESLGELGYGLGELGYGLGDDISDEDVADGPKDDPKDEVGDSLGSDGLGEAIGDALGLGGSALAYGDELARVNAFPLETSENKEGESRFSQSAPPARYLIDLRRATILRSNSGFTRTILAKKSQSGTR